MPGLWDRFRGGLSRTRQGLGDRIRGVFSGRQWSDELWDELEQVLYEADLGGDTVTYLMEQSRMAVRRQRPRQADEVIEVLRSIMLDLLAEEAEPWNLPSDRPVVWMLVGVNGTGKTTTAGKMAALMRERGNQVMLGAADTFRAAATEQLTVWAERARVPVIGQGNGADSAAVAFDAVTAAKARNCDLAIIDTAGRLHNKGQLMQELSKVHRVIGRAHAGAPHQVWLVIDATTGQNGLAQAQTFVQAVAVTGIIITKLDGTAKGGIGLAIARQLQVPIRWVGMGEQLSDLLPFDRVAYVDGLLGEKSAAARG